MHPALIALIITLGALLLLFIAFLILRAWALRPGHRNAEMQKYITGVKYAHRGLHDSVRAENSLSAFAAAKAAGYGIELDVRLSADGELVVFHDSTLDRVCGVSGKVSEIPTAELKKVSLSGTGEGIPTFREVLELIDGAIPMLIEIKQDPSEGAVAERLVTELEGYRGDYIVESFNPKALKDFKAHRPDVLIGILSTDYSRSEKTRGKPLYWLLTRLYLNFFMRPDFIAYEKCGATIPTLREIRRKFNTPLIAWTVKSEEEELRALGDGFDTVIFEDYLASKN